ncbi:MAG TPA: hypothetical protein DCW29_09270 [Janthinobacterium sp.]|nr:hypothetical protein [Janthinobacterium sp.]
MKLRLLAATLALPLAALAADEAPVSAQGMHEMREMQGRDMRGMPGMEHRPPFFGHGGEHRAPPFLHGLELSEAQQDKVFTVLHAQEPMLREQHKQVEKAHQALHELASSGHYDDAKASALAQAAAQAMARISLQQARTEQELLAMLTPEQRKEVERREQEGPLHCPRPQ